MSHTCKQCEKPVGCTLPNACRGEGLTLCNKCMGRFKSGYWQ